MKKSWTALLGFERYSIIYLFAGFVVIFGIWSPHEFLTTVTFHAVADEQAVSGMIAIAVLVALVCGQFDLSVGSNANVTGIVAVILQVNSHWSVVPAVLAAVAIGFAIGAVNGLLVVRFKVDSFIATLGMGSVLSAVLVIVTGSQQPASVSSTAWNNLTQTSVFGLQIVVVYLFVLAIVCWWFLGYTPIGRYMYAIGANKDAARLSGVRVNRWSWLSLVLSGGIAGLAGVFFTSETGPSLSFGSTLLLPAFAAAFLGSTQLHPGRFNIWGTILAIYALATGVQGLQLVSGQEWVADMFDGVALIVAVALSVSRQRRTREVSSPVDPGATASPPLESSQAASAHSPPL
jgi:ribose transport system permease protein